MTPQEVHTRVMMALTSWDQKQSTKRSYNRYALAQYCGAVNEIEQDMEYMPARQAILSHLCGRLADLALVAIGQPKATKDEMRQW
jgi:hypothetical protein